MKECVGKQSFLKRILFAFALALCATVVLSGRSAQAECYSLDAYTPQKWENPKEECNENEVISEMMRKWWQAPMEAVLKASVSVGNSTFSRVSGGALSLLTTGTLLWLALLVLKVVGSMTESDPMEWMTQVGGMMIKAGIAAVLLHEREFFFSYFFAPIIQAGAGFVDAGGVDFGGGGLSEASSAVMGIANSVHETIGKLTGKGDYLSCMAKIHIIDIDIIPGDPFGPFIDPGVWSAGCMIRFCGWFMLGAFPFFLMDACFRMGVTAALCPLFIVAWVFKSTRDFTQKGFSALLNVAFMFMIMKIVAMITTNMLMSAAGIQGMGKNNAVDYVCKFRWIYMDKDGVQDPCAGKPKDFLMPLVLFVCLIYSLMLMTKVEELAGHFSSTSFSNDAFFNAAKATGRGVNNAVTKSVNGAFAAKDRWDLHKDRAAARTVEKDRQAREKASAAGRPFVQSAKEAAKVKKAEQRLRKNGAIRADGSETQKYANLLKNGKARTAMNLLATPASLGRSALSKLTGGKISSKEFYKDASNSYNGMRGKEEVQKLDNVQTTLGNKGAASSQASIAAQKRLNMCSNARYQNAPKGQRQFDQDMNQYLQDTAQYRSNVAKNPKYASSWQGKNERATLQDRARDLNDRQKQNGFDDYIRSGTKEDQNLKFAQKRFDERTASGYYKNNPDQQAYDSMALGAAKEKAAYTDKITRDPSYASSAAGQNEAKKVFDSDNTLNDMRTEASKKGKRIDNFVLTGK